eukprot:3302324-Pyramimonas_sp.AAC.1
MELSEVKRNMKGNMFNAGGPFAILVEKSAEHPDRRKIAGMTNSRGAFSSTAQTYLIQTRM